MSSPDVARRRSVSYGARSRRSRRRSVTETAASRGSICSFVHETAASRRRNFVFVPATAASRGSIGAFVAPRRRRGGRSGLSFRKRRRREGRGEEFLGRGGIAGVAIGEILRQNASGGGRTSCPPPRALPRRCEATCGPPGRASTPPRRRSPRGHFRPVSCAARRYPPRGSRRLRVLRRRP